MEITRAVLPGRLPGDEGPVRAFVKDDGYQTEAEKANDKETWRNPGSSLRRLRPRRTTIRWWT